MAESIIKDCSKKDIDDATKKIVGILRSGRKNSLMHELQDREEREINQQFKAKYDISDQLEKELILKNLSPRAISDVQIDERTDKLRQGNKMYIYLLELELDIEEEGKAVKNKVDTYVKIEMIKPSGNKKNVLLISFHEPKYKMKKEYNNLRG